MAEDKDEVKENPEEKPKKSKLKLIIIGVIVLLLTGGGFYGYSKYKKGKEKENKKQVSIIIPMKSFVVNLFDKKGIGKRYLKMTTGVEVGSEEDKQKIENHITQLRDTILILLSSQTMKDINSMEGKLELKNEILLRMNQILGEKTVRRIFFTEFVVQ